MKKTKVGKKKLVLRDIASAADVSLATVSRVLNGHSRVTSNIREAVLKAAAELDFDPSQRNRTKALAFLLSNRAMLHPYHSRILVGAEASCADHGWDIVFLSFNYSSKVPWKELHLPRVVQRHDVVQGLILAGTTSTNLLELLSHKGIEFSVFGNNIIGDSKNINHDVVFSDDIQGGIDITRYLIRLGHRDIWFVGNPRLPWFARCSEGYRSAMEEAGLTPRQSNVDSEDATEIGYLGTKSLLGRGEPVTAIFTGSDFSAHGVYKGLADSGLSVPEDISVVSCDDTLGAWLQPALTTIREFPEQIGKQMVEALLQRIGNPGQKPQRISVPTELVKRDSCRPLNTTRGTSRAGLTIAVQT
ncbi:MAG TPA: LacI family DNA-binding transcriptional regulator [Acidobacteriaceae bacterium]|nr:LacI family DNA-binding transcriptional regulator [Acidobacteriaceae bacterium]